MPSNFSAFQEICTPNASGRRAKWTKTLAPRAGEGGGE